MSKKSAQQLKDRWSKIKIRDSLTSQTVFENDHLTLPEGFVGFFAYHFEVSCHWDITDLKELSDDTEFGRGCKKPDTDIEWELSDKIEYLFEEINHWDYKKYWPISSILAILAAFAAVAGSGIDSSSNIQTQLASVEASLSEGVKGGATIALQNIANASQDPKGISVVGGLAVALFIVAMAILIFELVRVHAQKKVWRLREALILLEPQLMEKYKKGISVGENDVS